MEILIIASYVYRKFWRKIILFLILYSVCSFYYLYTVSESTISIEDLERQQMGIRMHLIHVDNFYDYRLHWSSSNLGKILFKRGSVPYPNKNINRTFVVLLWKYWKSLEEKYQVNLGDHDKVLSQCSVNNCQFSADEELIYTADAVLVDLQAGLIPEVKHRNLEQRWIFSYEESPLTLISHFTKNYKWNNLSNIFNWSMSYRIDADVPIPYGRTISRVTPSFALLDIPDIATLIPYWKMKKRDILVAVYISDCNDHSLISFLNTLREYIKVDVFGKCPDGSGKRCSNLNKCGISRKYLFFLILQNSDCTHYLNEYIFNAYAKGAIPIIWGPSYTDVELLLPPNSYLYIDNITNIKLLAHDIKALAKHSELLISMHVWRNTFKVVYEHEYFETKTYHLCRLCEALNYNDEAPKIYNSDDLNQLLNSSITCKEHDVRINV